MPFFFFFKEKKKIYFKPIYLNHMLPEELLYLSAVRPNKITSFYLIKAKPQSLGCGLTSITCFMVAPKCEVRGHPRSSPAAVRSFHRCNFILNLEQHGTGSQRKCNEVLHLKLVKMQSGFLQQSVSYPRGRTEYK